MDFDLRGGVEVEFLGEGVGEGAQGGFGGGVGGVAEDGVEGEDGGGEDYVVGLLRLFLQIGIGGGKGVGGLCGFEGCGGRRGFQPRVQSGMSHVSRREVIRIHLLREYGDGRVDEEGGVAGAGAAPDDIRWIGGVPRRSFCEDSSGF